MGKASLLTAGLRGEHTSYTYDNKTSDGSFGRFFRPADREDDFFAWSPKLGWVSKIEQQTFFANLTRGHRAPQTTDLYRSEMDKHPKHSKPNR